MAAASRAARSAATVTGIWKSGIMYLPSLKMTAMAIMSFLKAKILIQAWAWSVWPALSGCGFHFDVDTIKALREQVCSLAGVRYKGKCEGRCVDPYYYRPYPFRDLYGV